MAVIEIAKIQIRRGQENQTGIPQLDPGEFAWAEDTERLYIGKRIAEGASTDENSRILTEQDLNFFKLASLSTTTSASAYQYREGIFGADTPVHRVQDKLDSYVTLFDFGVSPYFSNSTGITVSSTGTLSTNTFTVSTTTNISVGMRIVGAPTTTGITGYVTSVTSYQITSSAVNLQSWNNQEITFYNSNELNNVVDITSELTTAIQNLFNNIKNVPDARRRLIIPAGNFYISKTISLPPYTTIEGEGEDLTVLTMTTSSAMFVTVDAYGTGYPSMLTASTATARNISIKGMTLAYTATMTATTTDALLSLDNVKGAVIENVKFQSGASTGTGIRLRGHPTGGVDVETCSDIQITHCTFDNLYTGVLATGTVLRPVIGKSIFTNLDKGVVMTASPTELYRSPIGGKFIENRFDRISDEAIYVGVASHATNHISEQNTFRHVGNGVERGIDTSVATSSTFYTVVDNLSTASGYTTSTTNTFVINTLTLASNKLISLQGINVNDANWYVTTGTSGLYDLMTGTVVVTTSTMIFSTANASTTSNITYDIPNTNLTIGYIKYKKPAISFLADGNSSVNDTFNRKLVAATTSSSSTFYYNPLVLGNASVNSAEVTTATISANISGGPQTDTDIIKIPVTGKDQMLFMKYSLYSVDQAKGYSRKGVLSINISFDGFGSFNDRFNYSVINEINDPVFLINTDNLYKGYVILQCRITDNSYFKFEAQTDTIV